jgi:hypothetical protein
MIVSLTPRHTAATLVLCLAPACDDNHDTVASHDPADASSALQPATNPLTVALADGKVQGDMDATRASS